ncbi:MAG TPA: FAD-binding protein [Clostridia bacterium]|nr:FAD-binding protein [Clostridia bacterium]
MDVPGLVRQLSKIVGKKNALTEKADLETYGYDSSIYFHLPQVVVLPESTEQVSQIIKLANAYKVPVVARGGGTSLSGGAVPIQGGIVIATSRMNKVLEVDVINERAIVQPGITNLDLQHELEKYGYFFAPDPASQRASMLGGNIAENAGGMHCVKYGNTRDHITGLEIVLANGDVVYTGEMDQEYQSPDITNLFCGSEGTLGVITKAMVRLTRCQEAVGTLLAVFGSLEDAGNAVSEIIAHGILPASLEIMDDVIVKSLIKYLNVDLPSEGEAVLIVEVACYEIELETQMAEIIKFFEANNALSYRQATEAAERAQLWWARTAINGIFGLLGEAQLVHDPSVPVDKIGRFMSGAAEIGKKYGLIICKTVHAGDGNLHPAIMFNYSVPGQFEAAEKASDEILQLAIDLGGNITGEHGIGLEKIRFMPWQFSATELNFMKRLKLTFDPEQILNPGKIFEMSEP